MDPVALFVGWLNTQSDVVSAAQSITSEAPADPRFPFVVVEQAGGRMVSEVQQGDPRRTANLAVWILGGATASTNQEIPDWSTVYPIAELIEDACETEFPAKVGSRWITQAAVTGTAEVKVPNSNEASLRLTVAIEYMRDGA